MKFLITSILFITLSAFAEEEKISFHFDGELRLDTIFTARPTGEAGKTEFKIPAFIFNLSQNLTSETFVYARVRVGPNRAPTVGQTSVGKYQTSPELIYVATQNLFLPNDSVQYGLIGNPWVDLVGTVWTYSTFTDGGSVLVDRLNYTFPEDLGLSYRYSLNDSWKTVFWILNGEGALRDEVYASKDVGVILNYEFMKNEDSNAFFAIGYSNSRYDSFLSNVNLKERVHALLAYVSKVGISIGIEGFQGKDPVDAITQMQGFGIDFANGADLTSRGGQVAASSGGALYSRYSFVGEGDKKYELLLKGEYMMPMSSMPLWTWLYMSGFGYIPNDKMTFLLANNHYLYNDNSYGSSSSRRETDKTYLSARFVF